jgi:hypothetical protein
VVRITSPSDGDLGSVVFRTIPLRMWRGSVGGGGTGSRYVIGTSSSCVFVVFRGFRQRGDEAFPVRKDSYPSW